MKNYGKNTELSHLKHCEVNNSYGYAMSQKLLVADFNWVKNKSKFNEDFIKNYNNANDIGHIFLNSVFIILKNYTSCKMVYHFYQKE